MLIGTPTTSGRSNIVSSASSETLSGAHAPVTRTLYMYPFMPELILLTVSVLLFTPL